MRAGMIVVARMGASRRPGKMLADIIGRPLLLRLLDRLRVPDTALPAVLATTVRAEDDALAAAAAAAGCLVYRGSPEDVLERVLRAADTFEIDLAAVVEGDEFFTDRGLVDAALATMRRTGADCVKVRQVPIGAWAMAATRAALDAAYRTRGPASSDGWAGVLFDEGRFHAATFDAEPPLPPFDPRLRMTMDYEEDLEFARAIQTRLGTEAPGTLAEVLAIVDREPALIDINAFLTESYWKRLAARRGQTALQGET